MAFRTFIRCIISLVAAVPLAVTSVAAAPFSGAGGHLSGFHGPSDVVHVASKKKKKQKYVKTRNGRKGVLIGRVGKTKKKGLTRAEQDALAAGVLIFLGAALSGGGPRYHGGGYRHRGRSHCTFYDTPNPTSGRC